MQLNPKGTAILSEAIMHCIFGMRLYVVVSSYGVGYAIFLF